MSEALVSNRTPVAIITGFLGAGKSTLLNRILKDPVMADTAVIINEFGEVGIDNLLVEASGDTLVQLSNGCLCCTVRGELVDTLATLIDKVQTGRLKPIRRVVIETTGLADPVPVMQSVMGHPVIAQNFELDGVVTVVDAVNGLSTLERHGEARKQVAVADRLIVSKTSLVDGASLDAFRKFLRELNPRATISDGDTDEVATAAILANGLYDPATKIADVDLWLQHEKATEPHHHHGHHHHDVNRHGDGIQSFSIVHDRLIDPAAIEMFIDLLRSAHGDKLLRMKAVAALTDDPERPLVLHGVQEVFHPPRRLKAWPQGSDRQTRMVLITQNLSEAFVKDLFAAFTGQPRIDQPDRAALEENPLAVPGLRM